MIAFDIETAMDNLHENQEAWYVGKRKDKRLTDAAKIDANIEKVKDEFPLSPLTGKIILIGLVSDTNFDGTWNILKYESGDTLYFKQLGLHQDDTEKSILMKFWEIVSLGIAGGHRLVSFNGKQFDLPFIFSRCLYHNIPRPSILRTYDALVNKYNNVAHVDVYNVLSEGSQSEWANKLLEDEPLSSDGKYIPKWYINGDYGEIIAKNYYDLKQLYWIYKRMESWV